MPTENSIGSDRRKLVIRTETCETPTRGSWCNELWFDDWKWFKVYKGESELIEREVSFDIAHEFFKAESNREDADGVFSNRIQEIDFCALFPELPLRFTSPSDIVFDPTGWTLVDCDAYSTDPDPRDRIPNWRHLWFVFSQRQKYVEIARSHHRRVALPGDPTIKMLTPSKVARQLEVRGKAIPQELKKYATFKVVTADNQEELLADPEMTMENSDPDFDVCGNESQSDTQEPVMASNQRPSITPNDLHGTFVKVGTSIKTASDYSAGNDGYRRDKRIYELVSKLETNDRIVATIEKESLGNKWEPVVASSISECLARITQFDGLVQIIRKGGRPRTPKPVKPQEPSAKT